MKTNRRKFLKSTAGVTALSSILPMAVLGNEHLLKPTFPDAGHIFLSKPYLQNPTTDSMSIMWITNLPSYSYVEFGESPNLGQTVRNTKNGLVVAYNRINCITLHNLKSGGSYYYQVVSKEITKFDPYDLEYGETIRSEVYSFSVPIHDSEAVSLLIMNDIHDRPASIPHLMGLADSDTFDFVFFNGDLFNHQQDEQQIIDHMLTPCCDGFASQIPFYFVRGNHETRGKYARELYHYFYNPHGQQYFDFNWGPVHFTVLDTGEDKADDSEVYKNIVDFDSYRIEQLAWVKKVFETRAFKKAKFRVVFMHIPLFYSGDWHGTTHLHKLFSPVFNQHKIDICISGHTHRYGVFDPVKGKHNYPIIIGGGPLAGNRTLMKLYADNENLSLNMMRDDGTIVGSYKLTSQR